VLGSSHRALIMGEKVAPGPPAESDSPKEPGSPEGRPSRLGDGSTRTSEATLLAEERLAHPKVRTLRENIAITMEDPEDSKLAKGISVFMMFVILISTICFILESEVCDGMAESCQTPTTGFLPWDPWSYIFYYMEWISVLIFTADYCTRFACCGGPKEMWSFFWNIMNLIDLVAWLPFWLIGAASSPPFGLPERDASGVGGVGFVRAIRLVRVFRVFKAGKLRLGIKLFSGALVASIEPMSILCLVLTVTVIIFSSIIWLMEKPSSPLVSDHLCVTTGMCDTSDPRQGMQALCFGTIPSCFWWTLTTMTTVGYGDCYPITIPGKIFAVFVMMGGISVLALPITVMGSNFEKMVAMYEDDSKRVSGEAMMDDGLVSELELREFLVTKKREGVLRKDVDTYVPALIAKYDSEGRGQLTIEEFKKLESRVCYKVSADPDAAMRELKESVGKVAASLAQLSHRFAAVEAKLGIETIETIEDVKPSPPDDDATPES